MGIPLRGEFCVPSCCAPPPRPILELSLSLSLSDWRDGITFDHGSQEPHRVLVFYSLSKNIEKDGVVDAVEKFSHVAFKNKTIGSTVSPDASRLALQNIHAFVSTETNATRKRSRDKRFLKNRIDDQEYCVMQNPVADSRFVNMPLLRIADIETVIWAMAIGFIFQIAMQLKKISLKVPLELRDIQLVALVFFKNFPCIEEILHRYYLPIKVAINFH